MKRSSVNFTFLSAIKLNNIVRFSRNSFVIFLYISFLSLYIYCSNSKKLILFCSIREISLLFSCNITNILDRLSNLLHKFLDFNKSCI